MIHRRRFISSFRYAFEGVIYVLNHDQNLRVHLLVAFLALLAALLFQITPFETGLLLVTIFFVLVTEMLNSAIEKVVNLITNEHRIEAKIAKDISAGMVLVASIGAVIVGMFIFLPYVVLLL